MFWGSRTPVIGTRTPFSAMLAMNDLLRASTAYRFDTR
jgi:hypothetical protein